MSLIICRTAPLKLESSQFKVLLEATLDFVYYTHQVPCEIHNMLTI